MPPVAAFSSDPVVVACAGTTGFGLFAESGDRLVEGPFPLVEGFTERKLLAKATR
jgi:hypothetical protein